MTRAPSKAFRESIHRDAHAKLVQTDGFQTACEYALLEFLHELSSAPDPARGWDSYSQLYGARRVLDILKTLHQAETSSDKRTAPTLNYKV